MIDKNMTLAAAKAQFRAAFGAALTAAAQLYYGEYYGEYGPDDSTTESIAESLARQACGDVSGALAEGGNGRHAAIMTAVAVRTLKAAFGGAKTGPMGLCNAVMAADDDVTTDTHGAADIGAAVDAARQAAYAAYMADDRR